MRRHMARDAADDAWTRPLAKTPAGRYRYRYNVKTHEVRVAGFPPFRARTADEARKLAGVLSEAKSQLVA